MRLPKRYSTQIEAFLKEFIVRFVAPEMQGDAVFYLNNIFREMGISGIEIKE